MAVNLYKIKKWILMFTGNSLLHVPQEIGTQFRVGELYGYYNDLTNKVLLDRNSLKQGILPISRNDIDGKIIEFPTTNIQYGLGAYDLLLKDERYLNPFKLAVDWAINKQDNNGGWDLSEFTRIPNTYGAMCQGEGASLLLRAYKYFDNDKYLYAAKKALNLMIKPVSDGGTSLYTDDGIILLEFNCNTSIILNGWIFALFGLYDMTCISYDNIYKKSLDSTVNALRARISNYDNGYWSMYTEVSIASPFYHRLQIAQLKALDMIFPNCEFGLYKCKFETYQKSRIKRNRAFLVKAVQKIIE